MRLIRLPEKLCDISVTFFTYIGSISFHLFPLNSTGIMEFLWWFSRRETGGIILPSSMSERQDLNLRPLQPHCVECVAICGVTGIMCHLCVISSNYYAVCYPFILYVML